MALHRQQAHVARPAAVDPKPTILKKAIIQRWTASDVLMYPTLSHKHSGLACPYGVIPDALWQLGEGCQMT